MNWKIIKSMNKMIDWFSNLLCSFILCLLTDRDRSKLSSLIHHLLLSSLLLLHRIQVKSFSFPSLPCLPSPPPPPPPYPPYPFCILILLLLLLLYHFTSSNNPSISTSIILVLSILFSSSSFFFLREETRKIVNKQNKNKINIEN